VCHKTRNCKIGYSKDPKKRLHQLQTGSATILSLYGTIEGDMAKEKELHKKFAQYSKSGEWFEYNLTIAKEFMPEDTPYKISVEFMLLIVQSLSAPEIKVSTCILTNLYKDNRITINKEFKKYIAERTGLKPSTIDNVISSLCKSNKQVLIRLSKGEYQFNLQYGIKT
jgi:hypothetical protein